MTYGCGYSKSNKQYVSCPPSQPIYLCYHFCCRAVCRLRYAPGFPVNLLYTVPGGRVVCLNTSPEVCTEAFKIYRFSILSILSLDWTYLSDISCLHAQKKCNKTLQQLLYGLGVSDVQYTREYMSSSVLYGIGRAHLREKYTRQSLSNNSISTVHP